MVYQVIVSIRAWDEKGERIDPAFLPSSKAVGDFADEAKAIERQSELQSYAWDNLGVEEIEIHEPPKVGYFGPESGNYSSASPANS